MRMLTSVLGSTVSATAAVLAAFMGGLALGSWRAGRVIDRWPRPVTLFVACEVAVALAAIISTDLPGLLAVVYRSVATVSDDAAFVRTSTQFVLSVLFLLVPTTAMGATLPAIVRAAAPSDDAERRLAILYGVNTFGAAVGAFAAAFFLIPAIGLTASLRLVAGINLLNAVVAWLAVRGRVATIARATSHAASESSAQPTAMRNAVLATATVAGFAGLAAEVAWTRILVFGLGSTTYAFAAMLVTFLVGLAVGSLVAARVLARVRHPVAALQWVQIAVGIAGVASLLVYARLAEPIATALFNANEQSWISGVQLEFAAAALALLPGTLLMGAAFPVAYAAYRGAQPAGAALGRLYAANTLGAIAGSIAAAFLLIPALGLQRTVLLVAAANITCASLLAAVDVRRHARWIRIGIPAALAIALVIAPMARPLHHVGPTEQLLFYREGPMSTVSVVEDNTGARKLFIDKIAVAGTDPVLLTDQKSLAHVPMLLHPTATRALSVGFGSGGASWSFTRYSRLDRVDTVEIDPTVVQAAPYLIASHHGVLDHPKFRLIPEDARSFLLTTEERYDIISTDCTDLRYKSNALLYTEEYFQLTRRRLNRGGLVAVWLPLGGLSTDALRVALATFQSVFPHTSIWYMNNVPAHYALLIGAEKDVAFDRRRVVEQLREPHVAADLAEIGLADASKLFATFITDSRGTSRLTTGAGRNTDDKPILEFIVPRTGFSGSIAINLEALLDVRTPPALAATDANANEDVSRYWSAAGELVRGHAAFLRGNYEYGKAIRHYNVAATLNPDDADIPRLVKRVESTAIAKLAELQALVAARPHDVRARNDLGLLWLSRDNVDAAEQEFRAAAGLLGSDWTAPFNLALVHERRGDRDRAIASYREAASRDASASAVYTNLGLVLLSTGAVDEAITALQRAAELEPRSADARYNLALAYHRTGQYQRALDLYGEALTLRPAHTGALIGVGSIHLSQGRPNEARESLLKAIDSEPGNAEAHYNLGVLFDRADRSREAAASYDEALRFAPDHAEARNNLGILMDRAGDVEGAIAHYRAAIAARPEYAAAHTNLALALVRAGRPDEAAVEADQAIRLNSNDASAHVSLGLARWRSGDPQRAVPAFERALALDPSLDAVRGWLQKLRAAR